MEEILTPKALVLPKMTTAVRDTLHPEIGTIIYDTTQSKLCFAIGTAASADSWEDITSA